MPVSSASLIENSHWLRCKEFACNTGNLGLILRSGRFLVDRDSYSLQYSGLENSVDCIVHGVAKSWTQLSNFHFHPSGQFSSVAQSCLTLCDPMNRITPGLVSITNSWSSLRFKSIESVMPSSHLILCRPLLLLPPIPPSIRVFFNESILRKSNRQIWSWSTE